MGGTGNARQTRLRSHAIGGDPRAFPDDGFVVPGRRPIGNGVTRVVEGVTAKTSADPMDDRLRFYCRSHPIRTPIVTIHERQWAYCPGGYVDARDDHSWAAISPTHVNQVNPRHVGFVVVGKESQPLRVMRSVANRCPARLG